MSGDAVWYYAQNGQSVGPMTLGQLVAALPSVGGDRAMVYGPGTSSWVEARTVGAVMQAMAGRGGPPVPPAASMSRSADVIDYEIFGEEMQYVEVTLDPAKWSSPKPVA